MKYLKLFNESHNGKKFFTTEDIEDFFIDFIDSGDIEHYWTGQQISMARKEYVSIIFKINSRYKSIKSVEEIQRYNELLDEIGLVCRIWNLEFEYEQPGT